jgi:cell volume regulation protein A
VPIVLATFPATAGVPGSGLLFDLVFFIVVTSVVVQGATVSWSARLSRRGKAQAAIETAKIHE